MKNRLPVLALVGAMCFAAPGCGLEHSTGVLAPSSVSGAAGSNPGSDTTSTPTGSPSLAGTWASSSTPTLPSSDTCGDFQYRITDQTANTISGTFSGICGGGLVINGNANGQLNGTAVSITVTGTATVPGIPACTISLSGTGSIEDNGNTLRVPFAGTTCLGPVSGVEVLRRPQPAAEPTTLGEPSPVSPSPNQHVDSVRPRFTVSNASRSGPVGAITYQIEVANDEGFTSQFASWTVGEQPNQTVLDLPRDLSYSSVYYWHVRASDSTTSGPWSRTLAFATPNPPSPPPAGGGASNHVAAGPPTEARASQVVFATAREFPGLTAVFGSEGEAVSAADQLLRRTIWHLQRAGFQAGRQRNPSGAISSDKLTIMINGSWHVYDVYSLGSAGRASTVQFVEVSLPNHVPDAGLPD